MQIRKIYKRCLNIKLEALTLKFEFGFNMMGWRFLLRKNMSRSYTASRKTLKNYKEFNEFTYAGQLKEFLVSFLVAIKFSRTVNYYCIQIFPKLYSYSWFSKPQSF